VEDPDVSMTKISDLAAKYAQQLDRVAHLRRTVEMAKSAFLQEDAELDKTAGALKDLINANKPRVLIPIGHKRHLLVYSTCGSYGRYGTIEIVEETS
jgi:hypothetical protein